MDREFFSGNSKLIDPEHCRWSIKLEDTRPKNHLIDTCIKKIIVTVPRKFVAVAALSGVSLHYSLGLPRTGNAKKKQLCKNDDKEHSKERSKSTASLEYHRCHS